MRNLARKTALILGFIVAILAFTGVSNWAKTTLNDGTVAAPGLSFLSDVNTGIYRTVADTINFGGGGAAAATLTPGTLALKKTTTTNLISSDSSATATTTSAAALTLKATVDITDGDLLVAAVNSADGIAFKVTEQGACTSLTTLNATTDISLAGGDLTSSHATQTLNITSDTNATTCTSAVAAITMAPTATLAANDLVLEVNGVAAGSSVLAVDLEGDTFCAGDMSLAGSDIYLTGTGAAFLVSSAADAATSGTVAATTIKSNTNLTDGDLSFAVQNYNSDVLMSVTEQGAIVGLTSIAATTTLSSGTTLTVGAGTAISKVTSELVVADIPTAGAAATVVVTASVAGAVLGDSVVCTPQLDDAAFDEGTWSCFVESAGVVKIVYHPDATGGDPASMNWRFTLIKF